MIFSSSAEANYLTIDSQLPFYPATEFKGSFISITSGNKFLFLFVRQAINCMKQVQAIKNSQLSNNSSLYNINIK